MYLRLLLMGLCALPLGVAGWLSVRGYEKQFGPEDKMPPPYGNAGGLFAAIYAGPPMILAGSLGLLTGNALAAWSGVVFGVVVDVLGATWIYAHRPRLRNRGFAHDELWHIEWDVLSREKRGTVKAAAEDPPAEPPPNDSSRPGGPAQ